MSGHGLPARLAVVPVGALGLGDGLVPSAGSWDHSPAGARFTPRLPPVPGTVLAVVGRDQRADAGWRELTRLDVPPRPAPTRHHTAVVSEIEPVVDEVPTNLLRFTIEFSAPMETGTAAGHLRLVDEGGDELRGTLLEMPPELWDREGRRLTVLLEPGRIKRGLQPNLQAGPPLREGARVTLVVDAGILDADGLPLQGGATRSYRIGKAVRGRVDPALWIISRPSAPGEPVVVAFDRPLDRTLALGCLRIVDESEVIVPGRVAVDPAGLAWRFWPADPDLDGGFRLEIETRLEDLAGNSVGRLFDRDLRDPRDDGLAPDVERIWLSVPRWSADDRSGPGSRVAPVAETEDTRLSGRRPPRR